jgi:vacuolar protein sorting-associated protein 18
LYSQDIKSEESEERKKQKNEKLTKFFDIGGDDNYYDPKYALRICEQNEQTEACVRLYSSMKLYEDAVELCLLKQNIVLAKEIANKPDDLDEKKKLWLKIAKKVLANKENVKEGISFLKETDIIKLEGNFTHLKKMFYNFSQID